jgi:hypothetical protein
MNTSSSRDAGAAASTSGSASLQDAWKLAYEQALPELEDLSRYECGGGAAARASLQLLRPIKPHTHT